MAVTPASFRQDFNEFANPDMYSDRAINFWVTIAGNLLDPIRWGDLVDYGTELYVAHRLSLARRDAIAASVKGIPGQVSGVLSSKSIDTVSASYDVNAVIMEGAGIYNMSRYGIELWQLMGQMGSGGMQVQGGLPIGFDATDSFGFFDGL